MIIIDSSVLIEYLRAKVKGRSLFVGLVEEAGEELAVSILTHVELYSGKSVWEHKRARQDLEALFSGLKIVELTPEVSLKAGEIRARYGIHVADAVIAATALTLGAPLATLNDKHFEMIKELELYRF